MAEAQGSLDHDATAVRRWRQTAIASAVALVLLVAAFFTLDDGDTVDPSRRAAELTAVGIDAYERDDFARARQHLRAAVAADPDNALAHYHLGLIMQVVDNNPAGAEAAYRTAIRLQPDLAPTLFNLGLLRANAGAKQEAKEFYRRAIAADPQFAAPHLNLAFLLFEEDPNSPEAQAEFEKAKALDPALAARIPPQMTTTSTSSTAAAP